MRLSLSQAMRLGTPGILVTRDEGYCFRSATSIGTE